jgi:hypothetical protein
MARHKDANWNLAEEGPGYEGAKLAVLMDIRDELKVLNKVFACSNFLEIPRVLRDIRNMTQLTEANTRKRKAKKPR